MMPSRNFRNLFFSETDRNLRCEWVIFYPGGVYCRRMIYYLTRDYWLLRGKPALLALIERKNFQQDVNSIFRKIQEYSNFFFIERILFHLFQRITLFYKIFVLTQFNEGHGIHESIPERWTRSLNFRYSYKIDKSIDV